MTLTNRLWLVTMCKGSYSNGCVGKGVMLFDKLHTMWVCVSRLASCP